MARSFSRIHVIFNAIQQRLRVSGITWDQEIRNKFTCINLIFQIPVLRITWFVWPIRSNHRACRNRCESNLGLFATYHKQTLIYTSKLLWTLNICITKQSSTISNKFCKRIFESTLNKRVSVVIFGLCGWLSTDTELPPKQADKKARTVMPLDECAQRRMPFLFAEWWHLSVVVMKGYV